MGAVAVESETGVGGFALHGQHTEEALMDPVQRFAGDEPLEGLDAQGELALGGGTLLAEAAIAEPLEVVRHEVLRALGDAKVLGATTLDAGLHETTATGDDRVERLDDHAPPAGRPQSGSKMGIDQFALRREDAEDAFVDAVELAMPFRPRGCAWRIRRLPYDRE